LDRAKSYPALVHSRAPTVQFWHNTPITATSPSAYLSVNRQFILAERPVGMPKESDFKLVEMPVPSLSMADKIAIGPVKSDSRPTMGYLAGADR